MLVQVSGLEQDRWYRVLKIGEVPITDLYEAGKYEREGPQPEKRLAEDLGRVFAEAGKPLGETTSLLLVDDETLEQISLADVPVTRENRRRVRNAWRQRGTQGSKPASARTRAPDQQRGDALGPEDKASPFVQVSFEEGPGTHPDVLVVVPDLREYPAGRQFAEGHVFRLKKINDIPIDGAFWRAADYDGRPNKRITEDLPKVIVAGLDKPLHRMVALTLEDPETGTEVQLEGVPNTRENRNLLRRAGPRGTTALRDKGGSRVRSAAPIENTELFRARIAEFLNLARSKAGFSGVVLVARDGEPVYQGAFGYSHLESRTRNSVDTPFRIASLSKQFTAAAILHLEAQGKLSIDDPVHRYLPQFDVQPYREITIHHLLTHTSGLPRIPEGVSGRARWRAMSRTETPLQDYVTLACEMPLDFKPGQDFGYSNFGYRILSALIARVSGEDYADFMEQRVFRAVGLSGAGVARTHKPPGEARVAEGLNFVELDQNTGEPLYAAGNQDRNYGTGYGSGGVFISAADLLRWDRVLAGNGFLSGAHKTKLFQPVRQHYACGWIVKKSSLDGRVYQTHDGGNEGFFSKMMRVPEDDLVIIVLGNVTRTPIIDKMLDQLFRLCRSLPYQDL